MCFDCVVGESGEPGRHFRANLAQQHLPPSFPGIGWGQQVEEGGSQGGGLALFWGLAQTLFEEAVSYVACFFFVHNLFFSRLSPPDFTLRVLFSKSSCPLNVQTRRDMNDASRQTGRMGVVQQRHDTIVTTPVIISH